MRRSPSGRGRRRRSFGRGNRGEGIDPRKERPAPSGEGKSTPGMGMHGVLSLSKERFYWKSIDIPPGVWFIVGAQRRNKEVRSMNIKQAEKLSGVSRRNIR